MKAEWYAFDANVYIRYFRQGSYEALLLETLRKNRAYVLAPVLAELYAGTPDQEGKKRVDRFYQAASRADKVVFPDPSDWIQAGVLLRRYQSRYGIIEARHHLMDALIAVLASRIGAVLVTENEIHMRKWQMMLKASRRTLKLHIVYPVAGG